MFEIKKDSTDSIPFFLADTSGNGLAGLSPTVQISENFASLRNPVGSVSEIGGGWYRLTCAAADSSGEGTLLLVATASGAVDAYSTIRVVGMDPLNLGSWEVESGWTLQQAMRVILAALAGIVSVNATKTKVTFRDVNNTKNRIESTVDARGNRISLTLDKD